MRESDIAKKVGGVSRRADGGMLQWEVVVHFNGMLTDDEFREFHDFVRGWMPSRPIEAANESIP